MDREEYTSDEGNYSSISSTSGFSTFEDELDFRPTQIRPPSTDTEKHLLLQIDKHKHNVWSNIKHTNESKCDDNLLQKISQELDQQNVTLIHENKEWQFKFDALQKELLRLNADKECRESCIIQLKNKITEQQENIHNLTQQNFKFTLNLSTVNNELTTTKGTVNWYKNEWANATNERNGLQKELFLSKNCLRNKKLEVTRLEALVSDLKLQAEQDAKNLAKSVALSDNNKKEVFSLQSDAEQVENNQEHKPPLEETTNLYLTEIDNLKTEIENVKRALLQETQTLEGLFKEKRELVANNAVLQAELEGAKVSRSLCEENNKKLQGTIDYHRETIKRKDRNVLELKTQLKSLRIELDSSTKEKSLVQESINATRNKFQKLVVLQDELKEELKAKDKMVLVLEKKIQDSFMFDNWNKCAIEEFAIKEGNYAREIKELQLELENKRGDEVKLKLELDEVKKYCKSVITESMQLKNAETLRNEKLRELCGKLGLRISLNIEEIVHKLQQLHFTEITTPNLSKELELRCVNMAKNTGRLEEKIVLLQCEIKRLQDVIHLKNVQMRDKQRRCEVHYRALLNKIKEYKNESKVTRQENKEYKLQQLKMMEELNSAKLRLFQHEMEAESAAISITKKTERVGDLLSVLKQKEDDLNAKCEDFDDLHRNYDDLRRNYDELVSTHSICSSAIETSENCEQKRLDNDKIFECTIVNTQHALIEQLENEKLNALKLIKVLEDVNSDDKLKIEGLMQEKAFLQRLIIDMKATLNASAAKQKFNVGKPVVAPMDLTKFPCELIPNEVEILNLCTRKEKKPLTLLGNVQSLKREMLSLKSQLYA